MTQEMGPLYGELVIPYETHSDERSGITDEVRAMAEQTRLMIREAAYYLAAKRGFAPGHEMEDWLQAEKQILK